MLQECDHRTLKYDETTIGVWIIGDSDDTTTIKVLVVLPEDSNPHHRNITNLSKLLQQEMVPDGPIPAVRTRLPNHPGGHAYIYRLRKTTETGDE